MRRLAPLACEPVHLRRALLLFAIVLGLAALATTISRPPRERTRDPAPPPRSMPRAPSASPGPATPEPARLRLRVTGKRQERRLRAGRPATLTVSSREPGQVEIPSLGLDGAVEPLTPARFDVLVARRGRHELRFTPAGSAESRGFAVLRVGSP
jgi:hypothetical protein